jgi:ribonuclease T1
MNRVAPRALLLAAAIVVTALLTVLGVDSCSSSGIVPGGSSAATVSGPDRQTPSSGLPTVPVSALPAEARSVLAAIDRGGPYAHRQDDTVFGNFEALLPERPDGYYHEFTVATPGSPDRGERRLVVGQDGDIYYTSDHYESFRQVIR